MVIMMAYDEFIGSMAKTKAEENSDLSRRKIRVKLSQFWSNFLNFTFFHRIFSLFSILEASNRFNAMLETQK